LFEIKAREKFNRPDEGLGIFDRHMVDIPRIKFLAQRRYRANWPFVDGHWLAGVSKPTRAGLLKPAHQLISSPALKNPI
jgi:hypothetical protein